MQVRTPAIMVRLLEKVSIDKASYSFAGMYIALYIISAVALLCCSGWFASNVDWEPFIGILTSVASLITVYLNDEGRKSRLISDRAKRREDVLRGLNRIKKERGNLQHIAAAKGYKSEAHRIAVEDSSLELLDRELSPLVGYRVYRRMVSRLLAEIATARSASPKTVGRLLPLLESLETRLSQDL